MGVREHIVLTNNDSEIRQTATAVCFFVEQTGRLAYRCVKVKNIGFSLLGEKTMHLKFAFFGTSSARSSAPVKVRVS